MGGGGGAFLFCFGVVEEGMEKVREGEQRVMEFERYGKKKIKKSRSCGFLSLFEHVFGGNLFLTFVIFFGARRRIFFP